MAWILASASPRRRELLTRMGIPFTVEPATDEPTPDSTLAPEQAALAIARAKAEAVFARHPFDTVLGADTVVVVGEQVLGKPRDANEAHAMLRLLQGNTHRVITAVWMCSAHGCDGFCETASVEFWEMDDAEIAAYVRTGEPMDKAGAYGIQGLGMRYVRSICGDYYTVMGLPVSKLWHFARERGYLVKFP